MMYMLIRKNDAQPIINKINDQIMPKTSKPNAMLSSLSFVPTQPTIPSINPKRNGTRYHAADGFSTKYIHHHQFVKNVAVNQTFPSFFSRSFKSFILLSSLLMDLRQDSSLILPSAKKTDNFFNSFLILGYFLIYSRYLAYFSRLQFIFGAKIVTTNVTSFLIRAYVAIRISHFIYTEFIS